MFVKAVPNNRGKKGTYYCSFGLLTEEQLPYLKAMYAKKKPRLVYDDEH